MRPARFWVQCQFHAGFSVLSPALSSNCSFAHNLPAGSAPVQMHECPGLLLPFARWDNSNEAKRKETGVPPLWGMRNGQAFLGEAAAVSWALPPPPPDWQAGHGARFPPGTALHCAYCCLPPQQLSSPANSDHHCDHWWLVHPTPMAVTFKDITVAFCLRLWPGLEKWQENKNKKVKSGGNGSRGWWTMTI